MGTHDQTTNPQTKIELLRSNLAWNIKSFEKKADYYRRSYFITSMVTLVLSGIVTVIAGWKSLWAPYKDNVVLVIAAVATVTAGAGLFYSPKESWLMSENTLNKFRAMSAKLSFMIAEPSTLGPDQTVAELTQEMQATLDSHNMAWLSLRSNTPIKVQSSAPSAAGK